MLHNLVQSLKGKRFRPFLVGLLTIFLFTALVRWAGLPPETSLPVFAVGVVLFVGALFAFAYVFWHLLIRPLPATQKVPTRNSLRASHRQLLAVLVGISGINVVVGGFWDELWHRIYGVPFGEDLLWRPHLLIYSGFLIVSALSLGGFIYLRRRGQGTLQQRFRSDPVVGLVVLIGGFMIFTVPADPLWHIIYGEDISAWSLPHLIMTLSFVFIMILSAAIQLSTSKPKPWGSILKIARKELMVLPVLSFVIMVVLQVMTTEWDVLHALDESSTHVFWRRPEWLLPAIIVATGAFTGTLANHALRVYGAATFTGILALAIRLILVELMGADLLSSDAWIVVVPPMVFLDILFAYRITREKDPAPWIASGLAAMFGMVVLGYPLVNRLFVHPQIDGTNLSSTVIAGTIAALASSWVGKTAGNYLATKNKQLEGDPVMSPGMRLILPGALAAIIIFITLLIITAKPPV